MIAAACEFGHRRFAQARRGYCAASVSEDRKAGIDSNCLEMRIDQRKTMRAG
jgi:hypothetical protein